MVIGFSVFTYSCSYVQVAWIQRLMAITYWPMQKVRILSGFSHRCHKRQKGCKVFLIENNTKQVNTNATYKL